jgi:hypothetical protein
MFKSTFRLKLTEVEVMSIIDERCQANDTHGSTIV